MVCEKDNIYKTVLVSEAIDIAKKIYPNSKKVNYIQEVEQIKT